MMMTLRKIRRIVMAVSSTVIGWGCSGTENIIPEPENIPIAFTTSDDWGESRATINGNTTSFSLNDIIGVTAYYTPESESDKHQFMMDEEVLYNGSSWAYSPIKYWPANANDKITFYGYFPYSDSQHRVSHASTPDGIVTMVNVPDVDLDILLAETEPLSQKDNAGEVKLEFKHILNRLKFGFKTDNIMNALVQKIVFTAPTQGTYTQGSGSWSNLSSTEITKLTIELDGVPIDANEKIIDEFTSYMIPTILGKDTEITITIDNHDVHYKLPTDISLTAGNTTLLNFKVASTGEKFFVATFSLWHDGGSKDFELK